MKTLVILTFGAAMFSMAGAALYFLFFAEFIRAISCGIGFFVAAWITHTAGQHESK